MQNMNRTITLVQSSMEVGPKHVFSGITYGLSMVRGFG